MIWVISAAVLLIILVPLKMSGIQSRKEEAEHERDRW